MRYWIIGIDEGRDGAPPPAADGTECRPYPRKAETLRGPATRKPIAFGVTDWGILSC